MTTQTETGWISNNSFASVNSSERKSSYDPFSKDNGLKTDFAVSGVFFFVSIVVPNTIVVIVLLLGKKFRQPSDWLVLNLSLAYPVVSVFTGPIALAKYFNGVYPGREGVCNLQAFFSTLGIAVNLLIVTAMSIERYLALSKPFFYRRHVKESPITIFCSLFIIWLFAFVYSLLPTLRIAGKNKLTFSFCHPMWTDNSATGGQAFVWLTVSIVCLCAFVILICNTGAILSLWRMHKLMRRASSLSIALQPPIAPGSRSTSRRQSLSSLLGQRRASLDFEGGRANGITASTVAGVSAFKFPPTVDVDRPKSDRRRSSLSTVSESNNHPFSTEGLATITTTVPIRQQAFGQRRMSLPTSIGTTTTSVTRGIDGQLVSLALPEFIRTSDFPLEELSPAGGRIKLLTAGDAGSVANSSNQRRRRSSQFERRRRPSRRWRRPLQQGDGQCTRMIVVVTFFFVACFTPHLIRVIVEQTSGKAVNRDFAIAAQRSLVANAILNPFFYIILRRSYRVAFKDAFQRCCFYYKKNAGLPKKLSHKQFRAHPSGEQNQQRSSGKSASSRRGLVPARVQERLRSSLRLIIRRASPVIVGPLSDLSHQPLSRNQELSPMSGEIHLAVEGFSPTSEETPQGELPSS